MAAMRSVREVGAQEERSAGRPVAVRPAVVRAVAVRQAEPRAVAVRNGVVRAAAVLAVAGLGLTGCMSVGPGADEKHGTVPVGQSGTVGKAGAGASASPTGGRQGGVSGRPERPGGVQVANTPGAAPPPVQGEVSPGVNGAVAGADTAQGALPGEAAPGANGAAGGVSASGAPHSGTGSSIGGAAADTGGTGGTGGAAGTGGGGGSSGGAGDGRSGGGAVTSPATSPTARPSASPDASPVTPVPPVTPAPEPSAGNSGSSVPSPGSGGH
ncbi:hypothetical protein [Kitasatospora sp. NPDC059327]|uniref:hypothetical protein n=1 Tax=Kitasatospora sp. NPDC059327 TaxID=3346803 RepID=UPI0036763D12